MNLHGERGKVGNHTYTRILGGGCCSRPGCKVLFMLLMFFVHNTVKNCTSLSSFTHCVVILYSSPGQERHSHTTNGH